MCVQVHAAARATSELNSEHTALAASHASDVAQLRTSLEQTSAALSSHEGVATRVDALEANAASQAAFDALTQVVDELRAKSLNGGDGSSREVADQVVTLQQGQKTTQGIVLQLQTHVRTLLRKSEADEAVTVKYAEAGSLASLREEVQAALYELNEQLYVLAEQKADADKVEAALEAKAERSLMANKADRAFCEGLLSRFAVEVGRQLADVEHSQTFMQHSLEESVARLMTTSAVGAANQVRVKLHDRLSPPAMRTLP